MRWIAKLGAACLLAAAQPASAEFYQQFDTELSLEGRAFAQSAAFESQTDGNLSVSVLSEWYAEWNRDFSVTIAPFARFDGSDDERSHIDLREFYWQGVFNSLEVRLGVSKVFWGKTELLHLVDIINQTDTVENIDGEDKLGQPMLRLNWALGNVSVQAYALPYFRERPFTGEAGRLRAPLPVLRDDAVYESSDEEKHLDYALRVQGYLGALDYGLAWFSGTARNPQLLAANIVNTADGPQPSALQPFYGLLDQLSLDAQYTVGSWLLKLEAVWRDQGLLAQSPGQPPALVGEKYGAATGGFEYTQYGVLESAWDIGYLAEYLWDERNDEADNGFQNDLFLATRLAANDVRDTTLLGGVVMDLDRGSRFISLEASRRLNGSTKVSLEMRLFSNIDPRDALFYPIRQDDYVQLELTHYL